MAIPAETRDFLKNELEAGTYILNPAKIIETLRSLPPGKDRDAAFNETVLQLLAGLEIYHPGSGAGDFEKALADAAVEYEPKMKALQLVRQHVLDAGHVPEGLRLWKLFLAAENTRLRDFACRALLQTLTEMRVSGLTGAVLSERETREEISGLLKGLSARGWLEADELLDLLELNPE